MDVEVVIYVKYEWNTIVWAKISDLRHFVQDLLQILQNFVGTLRPQKPKGKIFGI